MDKTSSIQRRTSIPVQVGKITIGGDAPIAIQSMTNTDTTDISSTVLQIAQLARAGSELVRITVNNGEAADAMPHIREKLAQMNIDVPLIGDFHFNGNRLLQKHRDCAQVLDKYRINPGNVGKGELRDKQFSEMVEIACMYNKPIRIGVNWGSLDQDLLAKKLDENARQSQPKELAQITHETIIESALRSAQLAENIGLPKNKIILSCKLSDVQQLITVYRELSKQCDYALHLGLTEAGMGSKGIVASAAALAILLQEGVGDTIRISLTPEPGGDRTREVIVAQEILQTMGLRSFAPMVTACPGCGRTTSDYFQTLAKDIQSYLRSAMPAWKTRYPGVENMTVAVMGCVVNGPGESKHANIGISLPGTGEEPAAPVFVDGKKVTILRGKSIATDFQKIVQQYVCTRYGTMTDNASSQP